MSKGLRLDPRPGETLSQRRARASAIGQGHRHLPKEDWEKAIVAEIDKAVARIDSLQEARRKIQVAMKQVDVLTKALFKEGTPANRPAPEPSARAIRPDQVGRRHRRAHGPIFTCEEPSCGKRFRARQVLSGTSPTKRKNRFCSRVCTSRWWRNFHKAQDAKRQIAEKKHASTKGVTLIPGDPLKAAEAGH